MNKTLNYTKNYIENQKHKYIFLGVILLLGIISGILFIIFVTKEDKLLVKNQFESVIETIKNNKINYLDIFINSLSINLLAIISIYILSISIIGIPLIIFFIFIKGFTFGFSFISLISIYKLKGILLSFSYLFPHSIILLIVFILIGFHGINFSIRLFKYLFLKENIILNKHFKTLNKAFIVSLITVFICSLLEAYLSPFLIDLWV